MKKNISIAIHGGAGTILSSMMSEEKERMYKKALENAVTPAYKLLIQGGTAVDAVELAVSFLEDSPLFNAGKGSVFNAEGNHEMDASIMSGKNLECGAVTLVKLIKNPIKLARAVMDRSEHVILGGKGAEEFARILGLKFESENYFFDKLRFDQWNEIKDSDKFTLDHTQKRENKFGTVGAVAMDHEGNLAAATSTGGMTNKKFGRIGDSPIIGAGTYANNKTCAVSCTGHGELFIRSMVAYDVSCLMEYGKHSLSSACKLVVHDKLKKINGEGGLIAVDSQGNLEMSFNSAGMYRASINSEGRLYIGIYK